eukprot:CAMPEP_0198324238 /NCGR_PEP_ID=MMETSP1450-20131203/12305_1 /TAXON_ID=753684 ORGANISM="Madagascaria erythrocladiodes, Strain CCMP3234" /NCGR_SAMPLE_ID=MMETSP1450 /ASSEMBLY_ACC=CAM_ASM_001115 /LENGTH=38 /DNA_ID= /DNA_START= /DNA_END= /DNA_ORIENTATION=
MTQYWAKSHRRSTSDTLVFDESKAEFGTLPFLRRNMTF